MAPRERICYVRAAKADLFALQINFARKQTKSINLTARHSGAVFAQHDPGRLYRAAHTSWE
jgi:hypothetical protein